MYNYHMNGMDKLHSILSKVKLALYISCGLKSWISRRPNVLRTFFDAKADEILSIYSAGPSVNVQIQESFAGLTYQSTNGVVLRSNSLGHRNAFLISLESVWLSLKCYN
jgi:hypothetical protein